ncbi:hypothetical protein IGI04_013506 [Brassica rapa subsp. trilocularis]|uniref:Uncharacterized protein n=1 Tax=Brassica rapa subsp. trilocularis TaxID=1813537 RepID=A0ABQ7N919_BRACM|nr:hypothetical protein IGI04_013506 [Brassica rapa subsp. trilocularis]
MHYAMNADSEKEIVDTDSNKTFVLDKPTTARDDFLSAARSLVNQGQPSQALQAVRGCSETRAPPTLIWFSQKSC